MSFIVWLDAPEAIEASTGGKGRSLARLQSDGVPIPPGFVVTAEGYREFAKRLQLDALISSAISAPDLHLPAAARAAAAPIMALLAEAQLPPSLAGEVIGAYNTLRARGGSRVAVRSSALSEDAATASSAGLYETFLNREGEQAVLDALLDCYRSLWSPRAIQYRAIKRLQSGREAMAVVVLAMVPAEVAGVAFTANPLDGNLDQIVINASWGLGESVVSGRVTPDTFVLDKADSSPRVTDIALKETEIVPDATGSGVVERAVPPDRVHIASLTPDQLRQLVQLCRTIERRAGVPMDIEWAFAAGALYILQARPITGLRS